MEWNETGLTANGHIMRSGGRPQPPPHPPSFSLSLSAVCKYHKGLLDSAMMEAVVRLARGGGAGLCCPAVISGHEHC